MSKCFLSSKHLKSNELSKCLRRERDDSSVHLFVQNDVIIQSTVAKSRLFVHLNIGQRKDKGVSDVCVCVCSLFSFVQGVLTISGEG